MLTAAQKKEEARRSPPLLWLIPTIKKLLYFPHKETWGQELQRWRWAQNNQWRQTLLLSAFSTQDTPALSAASPQCHITAVWKGSTAHATNSRKTGRCWVCTDFPQLLLVRVSRTSQLLLQIHSLSSFGWLVGWWVFCFVFFFFLIKGIERGLDPCIWMEPLGKEEQAGELLLCGVTCAFIEVSDRHQGEVIPGRLHTPTAFFVICHIVTGMQTKMSPFTYNSAVTDLKAELLPFKSHLAQSFAIKIIFKFTSPGTLHLCAFSVSMWIDA